MADVEIVTTSGAILGQILVKLRNEAGLKQNELAEAVGLSPSTWSRIEKGDSGLSIDQLRAAARALGVSSGQILEMLETAEKEVSGRGVDVKPTWEAGSVKNILIGAVVGPVLPLVGAALGSLLATLLTDDTRKDEKKR